MTGPAHGGANAFLSSFTAVEQPGLSPRRSFSSVGICHLSRESV
jgi:hypothetical protein